MFLKLVCRIWRMPATDDLNSQGLNFILLNYNTVPYCMSLSFTCNPHFTEKTSNDFCLHFVLICLLYFYFLCLPCLLTFALIVSSLFPSIDDQTFYSAFFCCCFCSFVSPLGIYVRGWDYLLFHPFEMQFTITTNIIFTVSITTASTTTATTTAAATIFPPPSF